MNDPKTLLLNLLAVIPDDEKTAAFFAEDGTELITDAGVRLN
jgi:hypothetical protein